MRIIFFAPTVFTALVPVSVPLLRPAGAVAFAPQPEVGVEEELQATEEGDPLVRAAERAAETFGSRVRGFLDGGLRLAIMGRDAV